MVLWSSMERKQRYLLIPQEEYTNLLLSSVPEMDPDWLNRLLAARSGVDAQV
jgi:peptide/nickel transport system ATP-binding protein